MTPNTIPDLDLVRQNLEQQREDCLAILEQLSGGAGALCRVTMSVNDLGKIDLYQWLYFIAMHIRRHLSQLAELENSFGTA